MDARSRVIVSRKMALEERLVRIGWVIRGVTLAATAKLPISPNWERDMPVSEMSFYPAKRS
jgi:hypothetical protein